MPRISLPPFLKKLQAVCSEVDETVANWSPDGNTFIVNQATEFEAFLGRFFKGSLLTFIRQLHFYGFRKVDIKGEKWSFSHKCFRRDYPHLVYEIRRKTRTETNDGIASQLEVQALRNHVGQLQDVIDKMQAQMKEFREEISELKSNGKRKFDIEEPIKSDNGKRKKLAAGESKKLEENAVFDNLGGIFDGDGFFGDGFDLLPFADSAFEQKLKT